MSLRLNSQMAFWSGASFQNLSGAVYSQLESLHDLVMVWLVVILLLVIFISYKVLMSGNFGKLFMDSQTLEKTWTLLPMLVLLSIAYPSLHLLCLQDSMSLNPSSFAKIISNQWNWQSEVSSIQDHLLDSDKIDELSAFESPMPLAFGEVARILVTSSDVLHSLGLPSLGVKLDSAPGRLNATTVELSNLGLMVGSCYELCGSGHSAMPLYALVV